MSIYQRLRSDNRGVSPIISAAFMVSFVVVLAAGVLMFSSSIVQDGTDASLEDASIVTESQAGEGGWVFVRHVQGSVIDLNDYELRITLHTASGEKQSTVTELPVTDSSLEGRYEGSLPLDESSRGVNDDITTAKFGADDVLAVRMDTTVSEGDSVSAHLINKETGDAVVGEQFSVSSGEYTVTNAPGAFSEISYTPESKEYTETVGTEYAVAEAPGSDWDQIGFNRTNTTTETLESFGREPPNVEWERVGVDHTKMERDGTEVATGWMTHGEPEDYPQDAADAVPEFEDENWADEGWRHRSIHNHQRCGYPCNAEDTEYPGDRVQEDTMLEDVDGADPNDPDPEDYGMYVIESPQWRYEYPSFTGNVYFWPDAFLEEEQYDHVDGYTGGNPTEEQADQLGGSYRLMEFERPNMVEVEYYVWEDANLEDSPQVVSDTEPDASESGWERQEVVGYVWDQTDSPTDRDFVYETSEYVNRLPWYGEEVPPDKCVTDYEGNEECASWYTVSEERDYYWGWYDSYWYFRGDYEFNYEKVPQYRWTYDVTEEIDLYDYELTEQITVAGTIFPDGTSGDTHTVATDNTAMQKGNVSVNEMQPPTKAEPMQIVADGDTGSYAVSVYQTDGTFVVERDGAEVWSGDAAEVELRLVENEIRTADGTDTVQFAFGDGVTTRTGNYDLLIRDGAGVTGQYSFEVDGEPTG